MSKPQNIKIKILKYLGLTIFDVSNIEMYEFCYDHTKET